MDNNKLLCIALVLIVIIAVLLALPIEGMIVSQPQFVLFYNPNCNFCQVMMPEWDRLSAENISCAEIKKVDVLTDREFANSRNITIRKVPTIVFFPFGEYNSYEVYNGERSAEAMRNWLYGRLKTMQLC